MLELYICSGLTATHLLIMSIGSRPSREWAARYLKTRADLDNLETPQEGWSLYNISPALPQQRLDDVLDSAIFPKTLTISPGRVHAANDSVLEHTASVVPGISGGAGQMCYCLTAIVTYSWHTKLPEPFLCVIACHSLTNCRLSDALLMCRNRYQKAVEVVLYTYPVC